MRSPQMHKLQFWISEKNKARIKCPKRKCPKRIHENDIDAMLDIMNDDLNWFMMKRERNYLLHQHRKQSIFYAFGNRVKQCPLCKVFIAVFLAQTTSFAPADSSSSPSAIDAAGLMPKIYWAVLSIQSYFSCYSCYMLLRL